MKRRVLPIAILVVAVPVMAQLKLPKPGFNLFSKDQDVQLGKEAASQVERQMQVVNNPELQSYIATIGRKLVSSPEAGQFPYTFKVINDQSINAFALPGGPTYVFTGLIRAADNEAQLAGVMAHEISHVALRHGTNQASKANLIQLPAMLAGVLAGGSGSMLGQLAQLGIGLGANSVLLKFSRSAERDADALGAKMMSEAGYNPIEMARFFEKLEAQGGSRGPEFLSDHPNPGNRVKAVEEEIRYFPQQNFVTEQTGQFSRMKSLVGGIPAPANSKGRNNLQQAPSSPAPRNVRPSSRYRPVNGQNFSLQYPDNWKVFGDNQSNMLTIAPQEAIFQGSGGATQIGYGAMVSYYFPQGSNVDLKRDTQELIRQLAQGNTGMKASGSKNYRIDGNPALITTLYSQSPYRGEREVDSLVTVARPEGLFYIIFIAPESEWRDIQPAFEQMLGSVRFR